MLKVFLDKSYVPADVQIITSNDVFFNATTSQMLDERADYYIEKIDGTRRKDKFHIYSELSEDVINIKKLSTAMYDVIEEYSTTDRRVKCFNYTVESEEVIEKIKRSKGTLFVIDNFDILSNDEMRIFRSGVFRH